MWAVHYLLQCRQLNLKRSKKERFRQLVKSKPRVSRKCGCQMNFLDSEVAVGILAREGFELVDSPGKADVILFNGCSVRQHAEERVWGGLGALKKIKAKAVPQGDRLERA